MQRRSRDLVEQILSAASEILYAGGIDALSTRALAERSGVSVGGIYRYFRSCDEIVAAFLEREMERLNATIAAAVLALERVTLRGLIEAAALAHLEHHRRHPETVTVWFGGRRSEAVRRAVKEQDARLAAWLGAAIDAAGFYRPGVPPHWVGAVVRMADRMFEYVLLEVPRAEQDEVVHEFIDMVASYAEGSHASARAVTGVPVERFALGFEPVPASGALGDGRS